MRNSSLLMVLSACWAASCGSGENTALQTKSSAVTSLQEIPCGRQDIEMPDFCKGPWQYERVLKTVEFVGETHCDAVDIKTCRKWEFSGTPDSETKTLSPIGQFGWSVKADEYCRKSALAESAKFAQAQGDNVREVKYSYSTSPMRNCRWDNELKRQECAWSCTVTLAYKIPPQQKDTRCGCEGDRWHKTQQNTERKWIEYSEASKSKTDLTNELNSKGLLYNENSFVCTTCDDKPVYNQTGIPDPNARYNCLVEKMNDSVLLAKDFGPSVKNMLIQSLKLIYETHGNLLDDQAKRDAVRQMYQSSPNVLPGCGIQPPAPASSKCPPMSRLIWKATLCGRMASAHVRPEVAAENYGACTGLLNDMSKVGWDGNEMLVGQQCESDRHFPYVMDAINQVLQHLLAAQGLYVDASGQVSESSLSDQLHRINDWYFAQAKLNLVKYPDIRDLTPGETEKVFAKIAAAKGMASNDPTIVVLGEKTVTAWTTLEQSIRTHLTKVWEQGSTVQRVYEVADKGVLDAETMLMTADGAANGWKTLQDTLGTTMDATFAMDQKMLSAVFSSNSKFGTAVEGKPLAMVLTDAMSGLVGRIDNMTLYHDLGCAFADCPRRKQQTPLLQLYRVIGALDDQTAFASRVESLATVTDPSKSLTLWIPVFRRIAANQATLVASILQAKAIVEAAKQSGEQPFGAATWQNVANTIEKAKERVSNYENSGFFDQRKLSYFVTPVHLDERIRILNGDPQTPGIKGYLADLKAHFERNKDALFNVLHLILNRNDSVLKKDQLKDKILSQQVEEADIQNRIYAHMISSEDVTEKSDLEKAFETIKDPVLNNSYFAFESKGPFTIKGDSQSVLAKVGYRSNVTDYAVPIINDAPDGIGKAKPIALKAGEIFSLSASGLYAPTCNLQRTNVLVELKEKVPPNSNKNLFSGIDTNGEFTGPGGYTVEWTGSGYKAKAVSHGESVTDSKGNKTEACFSASASYSPTSAVDSIGKTGANLNVGLSLSNCSYYQHDESTENSTQWSTGVDFRTSASFNRGLFLKNSPVPDAPVGSLVIIEMQKGQVNPSQAYNMYVPHSGSISFQAKKDADIYLVVNDLWMDGCKTDTTAGLEVYYRITRSMDELIGNQILSRMACALKKVRSNEQSWVSQGEILPSQREQVRTEVMAETYGDCPELPDVTSSRQVPWSQYPPDLQNMFLAFFNREMAQLEHRVALSELGKKLARLQMERQQIQGQILALNQDQTLKEFIARTMLTTVDMDFTRWNSYLAIYHILDKYLPIAQMRYPEMFERTRITEGLYTQADKLIFSDFKTPMISLMTNVTNLIDAVLSVHGDLASKEMVDYTYQPVLSVHVRDAEFCSACLSDPTRCGVCSEDASLPYSSYRCLATFTACKLLTAMRNSQPFTLSVTPEMLYQKGNDYGTVPCGADLPVLRSAGLSFVFSEDIICGIPSLMVNASQLQTVVNADSGGKNEIGIESERILQSAFSSMCAKPGQSIELFNHLPGKAIIGMSPFQDFHFEAIAKGSYMLTLLEQAIELQFVFDLETTRNAAGYWSWISTCK